MSQPFYIILYFVQVLSLPSSDSDVQQKPLLLIQFFKRPKTDPV